MISVSKKTIYILFKWNYIAELQLFHVKDETPIFRGKFEDEVETGLFQE